jgi:hypothetical protein
MPFSGRLATVTSSTELALSRRLGAVVAAAIPPRLAALSVLGRLSVSVADRGMCIRGDVGERRLSALLLGFRTFGFNTLEAESYTMVGGVGV